MERKQQKQSIILKYSQRRYDGGLEIEQIRAIEHKQAVAQLNNIYSLDERRVQPLTATSPVLLPQAETPVAPVLPLPLEQTPRAKKSKRIFEAYIMGPMELCVGVVGMLTSLLAIYTFSRTNNEALVAQSKTVFNDCLKTFNKGILDTLTAPVRALKVAVSK